MQMIIVVGVMFNHIYNKKYAKDLLKMENF